MAHDTAPVPLCPQQLQHLGATTNVQKKDGLPCPPPPLPKTRKTTTLLCLKNRVTTEQVDPPAPGTKHKFHPLTPPRLPPHKSLNDETLPYQVHT